MTRINGRSRLAPLAPIAMLCAAACATPSANLDKLNTENARNKAALVAQGDAASLMTAALMAWTFPPGPPPLDRTRDADQRALFERAIALAPNDPAILWINVSVCANTPGCDAVTAAARFRALDGGNAAGWLPDLRAAADQGPDTVDRVLHSMAAASRFDVHFNRLVTEVAGALERARVSAASPPGTTPRPAERIGNAAGLVAATAIPPLQTFVRACTDPSRRATREESCRAILKATINADTVLVESLGARLRMQLEAPEDPDRIAAEAWRRRYEWQRHELAKVEDSIWHREERAESRLKLMASLRREQDVISAMLSQYGRPLEPPANWKSTDRQ